MDKNKKVQVIVLAGLILTSLLYFSHYTKPLSQVRV